jgi:hypothetical protein
VTSLLEERLRRRVRERLLSVDVRPDPQLEMAIKATVNALTATFMFCKVCGALYEDLERHCLEKGDDAHLVLSVMET